MRLILCLAFSLLLHAMLLAARSPASTRQDTLPPALEVALQPAAIPTSESIMPEDLASLPIPPDIVTPPPPPPAPAPATHALKQAPAAAKPDPAAIRHAQGKLMERLLYPPQAIALGLEGEVVLLLALDAGGRVASASVARTSGHALLDAAALEAVSTLGPLRTRNREILLPVEFSLD